MVLYSNLTAPDGSLVVNGNQTPYNSYKQGYPAVFEIIEIKDKGNKRFELKEISKKYTVPKKLYGKLKFYINFYWKSFIRKKFKSAVLLTGIAGAGKTEIAKVLSNQCIDYGLRVVSVTNIRFSPELLQFLEELESVVLFFDEYGKNFRWDEQQKMLTLISNTLDRERIVLLTENDKNNISSYIRNRMSRVPYAKDFEKLESETVREYMDDFHLSDSFKQSLLELYQSASVFAFDHLQGIVDEHLANVDIPFNDLIDLLNLDIFTKKLYLHIEAIKYIGTDEELAKLTFTKDNVTMTPYKVTKEAFMNDYITVSLIIKHDDRNGKDIHTGLNKELISFFDKNNISFKAEDFIIECIFDDKNPTKNTGNSGHGPNFTNNNFRFGSRNN